MLLQQFLGLLDRHLVIAIVQVICGEIQVSMSATKNVLEEVSVSARILCCRRLA